MGTEQGVAPPHSIEAEQGVLGALLLTGNPSVLKTLLTEEDLRPEHFYLPLHANIFRAIIAISDEGAVPDVNLVGARVNNIPEVDALTGAGFATANVVTYARIVKEKARWRKVLTAGHTLVQAAATEDHKLEDEADELLTAPETVHQSSYTPERLQDLVFARMEQGEVPTIPLPFMGLTALCGGLRRGEMVLLGGHTSFGKSLVLDHMLTRATQAGYKSHLYLNEMNAEQRVDRFLAAESKVPFGRIRSNKLTQEEMSALLAAAENIPFGITDAAGWSAEEIARHMRYHDFDFVGVDILHLIDHTEEKDLNRISRVLNQASKIAQVALVATVHLNRGRSLQAVRPRPVVTDIKGSSSFEQQADMVMFVHREQDVHGEPTDDGKAELFIAKGRNTRLGGVDVWLNPNTMRFQENSWL